MCKILTRALALIGLLHLIVGAAPAEVVDSSAHGFTVRSTVTVQTTAKRAYQAFVKDVGRWWDSEHTYTGRASSLSIDTRLGGFFFEKLPGGGFVEHMRVVHADPGKVIRMIGGLGPLQELGAAGAMTVTFTQTESRTEVTMTYAAGGYMKQGLGSMATIVNSVLSLQLDRFQGFVDKKKG